MSSSLLRRVLAKIKPTSKEYNTEKRFASSLVRKISAVQPKGCKVVLTGSVEKGTFLCDSKDIDIFVLFPGAYPKSGLEAAVETMVKKAFPGVGYKLSYAEHPYIRFHFSGRRIDLVPAYAISKAHERLSAVDRSVLHARYVLDNMSARQKDGVLLLKRFLKSNGLYGAEIKVEGFSGYLCELLLLKYGSFTNLLSAASRWKLPFLVDLEGFYRRTGKNERNALFDKFSSRFLVFDPTDENRNVAAALSEFNITRFVSLAREFRKKPSEAFFFRKPESFDEKVKKMSEAGNSYVITMLKPEVVDDVLWGQLKKLTKQLSLRLVEDEFGSRAPGFNMTADDSGGLVRIAFMVNDAFLPRTVTIKGPPLSMLKPTLNFMRQHRNAKFARKKGRIFAVIRRAIRTPVQSAAAFFSYICRKGKSHFSYPLAVSRVEPRKKG